MLKTIKLLASSLDLVRKTQDLFPTQVAHKGRFVFVISMLVIWQPALASDGGHKSTERDGDVIITRNADGSIETHEANGPTIVRSPEAAHSTPPTTVHNKAKSSAHAALPGGKKAQNKSTPVPPKAPGKPSKASKPSPPAFSGAPQQHHIIASQRKPGAPRVTRAAGF